MEKTSPLAILAVEDQSLRKSVEYGLETLGFSVGVISEAKLFIPILQNIRWGSIHLIVLDDQIGGPGASYFIQILREFHPDTPVALLVTEPGSFVRKEAWEEGVFLIEKPFGFKTLQEKLESILFIDGDT